MKTLPFYILLLPVLLSACGRTPKTLATVEIGMSKPGVTAIVGEPKQRNTIQNTEIWDYPDSGRTIVFRKDTVYTILTSPGARADSVAKWVSKTGDKLNKADDKVAKGIEKIGDKINDAGKKISDKLKDKGKN
ncbi:hypothetical protein [Hufsiella ginkgonis]|uniref:Outer membrane protein assembly factor BamE n=1 Tax=Hufsiella ginkgonis TaxID=2695274 RepID=A0A7K1XZ30_9SPHI|nr:hypothetical protein [Hufsiella ginkgonis]MXV16264.1 hypothetical protein [Hufsiella ginkgonis]